MHSRIFYITRSKDFDRIDADDIFEDELLGIGIDSIKEIPKELWEKPNGDFGNVPEVKDLIQYFNHYEDINIEYNKKDFSITLNGDALRAFRKYFDEKELNINDKYGFLFIDDISDSPGTEYDWLYCLLNIDKPDGTLFTDDEWFEMTKDKKITLYIHQIYDYHFSDYLY